jgi:hypothetical protein
MRFHVFSAHLLKYNLGVLGISLPSILTHCSICRFKAWDESNDNVRGVLHITIISLARLTLVGSPNLR